MRDQVLDALRSTWAYLASCLAIDPDGLPAGIWESIADDVVAEIEMWMSAAAVMGDWNRPIGTES